MLTVSVIGEKEEARTIFLHSEKTISKTSKVIRTGLSYVTFSFSERSGQWNRFLQSLGFAHSALFFFGTRSTKAVKNLYASLPRHAYTMY